MSNDDFRDLVKRMRAAQKEYFRTRSQLVLSEAKGLERQVDLQLALCTQGMQEQ
jgi:hypothetical protein